MSRRFGSDTRFSLQGIRAAVTKPSPTVIHKVMLPTTIQIIRSALQADPTVTPRDRARLLALLRKRPVLTDVETRTASVARIIRRSEAASRLSCSLRTVDKLAATGVLRKRRLPGRLRSAGFLEADVTALITAEKE